MHLDFGGVTTLTRALQVEESGVAEADLTVEMPSSGQETPSSGLVLRTLGVFWLLTALAALG